MSLLRVGDISIHLTTTRFDLTFPYIPYSFSTWFSSPMTCRAYELCISHASLDLLRSLNQDQSSGGFSSAMVDPDNKNKRTKTALLIMRISLMLITLAINGARHERPPNTHIHTATNEVRQQPSATEDSQDNCTARRPHQDRRSNSNA